MYKTPYGELAFKRDIYHIQIPGDIDEMQEGCEEEELLQALMKMANLHRRLNALETAEWKKETS